MKILVSTRTITYSCGAHFLYKNRIVVQPDETRNKLYRNVEDYNRGIGGELAPVSSGEFDKFFRAATPEEEKAFYNGVKYATVSDAINQ